MSEEAEIEVGGADVVPGVEVQGEVQSTKYKVQSEVQGTKDKVQGEVQGTKYKVRSEVQGEVQGTRDEVQCAGEQVEQVEPVVNPFDFTAEAEGEVLSSEDEVQGESDVGEEYVLDFGAAFGGTDAVRDMITGHARAAGISAEAGSKFISCVCEELRQDALRQAQEGYRVLEEEWKGDFGRRMERCKGTLHELLKEGVVSEQDVGVLMNPAVFRVVDKLRGMLGERSAVGTRQAAAASAKARYDAIMGNPKCEEFQILMNPSHPRYRQTADYVNGLAGSRLF